MGPASRYQRADTVHYSTSSPEILVARYTPKRLTHPMIEGK
jgi:hypothetical protein